MGYRQGETKKSIVGYLFLELCLHHLKRFKKFTNLMKIMKEGYRIKQTPITGIGEKEFCTQ